MSSSQSQVVGSTLVPKRVEIDERAIRERRRFARNRTATIILFLAPGFFLLLVFLIIPIFQAIYYSLFRWNGLGPLVDFQGLENYSLALTNTVFHQSLLHTALLIALSVAIQLPFAMFMALTLLRGNLQ